MRIVTLGSLFILGLAVVARPGRAAAQTSEGTTAGTVGATHGTGLGLGAAAMFAGPGGVSVAYDAGPWHLDSMLGVEKRDSNNAEERRPSFGLGGRFWYHLHKAANADFSVGGGLGIERNGPRRDFIVTLEGGGQLRAFIVSNVALSVSGGLGLRTIDRSTVDIGAQFISSAAIHYYFY